MIKIFADWFLTVPFCQARFPTRADRAPTRGQISYETLVRSLQSDYDKRFND